MRVALVAAVLACASPAWAEPTRRVHVDTTPPKAHVYLDDIDSGLVCETTPCDFDAPIGTHVIIVRLEGHKAITESLDVKKSGGKRAQVASYKLEAAGGTLVIEDPRAKGATVEINGEVKGKVPARIDLEPDVYQVIVTLGGKKLYADAVEIGEGEKVIELANIGGGGGKATPPPKDEEVKAEDEDESGGGGKSTGGGGGSGESGGSITKPSEPAARGPIVSIGLLVDVGWRRFHYDSPAMSLSPYEGEDGQVVAGPAIELWPASLLGLDILHGVSLFVRAEFKVNQLDVTQTDQTTGMTIQLGKTYWESYEASLRQRWNGESLGLEVSGGYTRDLLEYDTMDADKLPVVDYQSMKLGARGFLRAGVIEPYAAADVRFVFSGGPLQDRFTGTSLSGVRGAVGLAAATGSLFGRVEASYLHYSWSFATDTQNPQAATGASDKIFGFSVTAGYRY